MGAVISHNAQANSQTLILGIKLLSGWHRMTRQSEAMRPLNFSPLICKKMCGMTSAPMKTRLGGGGGGRRRDRGCPVELHGPTVADKDETRTAIRERGRPHSSDRHGIHVKGC